MIRKLLLIGLIVFMTSIARADSTSIGDMVNAMGAQAGYFHGIRAGHGYSYLATKIAVLGPEKWNLSLDGGVIATSGAAITVDYDLLKAWSLQQVPVLGFFSTAKVGVGGMVTDITAWSDGEQVNRVDNRLDYGFDALLSKTVKFGPQGN